MNTLIEAQVGIIVATLAAAAISKLIQPEVAQSTKAVFLLGRVASRQRVAGWYLLALVEAALAACLLAIPTQEPRIAAAALFVVMTVFAGAAVRFEPESTCGCFGAGAAVSWRTAARSGLLAAVAASTLLNADARLLGGEITTAIVVLAEVVVLVRLSLPAGLLLTVRRLRYRIHTPACLTSSESVEASVRRLRASKAWRALAAHIADSTEPVDHWREGCWRFVTFSAAMEDGAQAVFAIHLPPGRVSFSGAIVSAEGITLAAASSRDRPLRWRKRSSGLSAPATAA